MSMQQESDWSPEAIEWDVVVVGTGMGGGTLGHALAKAGRRVLFVEKGRSNLDLDDDSIRDAPADDCDNFGDMPLAERLGLLARGGRSTDEVLDVSGRRPTPFTPFIGGGTGGSTALYGMALERLFAADFAPREHHRQAPDTTLPETWPISYETLRPWYVEAERQFRVRGTPDPLRPADGDAPLMPPPALTPGNAELFAHFQKQGLHPYQLHIGCEHQPGCQTCQGYLCANECKSDAGRLCVLPAVREHGARLLTECAAQRIETDGTSVKRVICRWRGRDLALRSKVVVLAAGALVTPLVLLDSRSADWPKGLANGSDMVGRNLMRHAIDLFLVKLPSKPCLTGQVKELSLNDFYFADGEKLGSLQSFGPLFRIAYFLNQPNAVPWFLRIFKPLMCKLGDDLRSQCLVLTTIMEDLPYLDNRVVPTEASNGRTRIELSYNFRPYELRRLKRLRGHMERILKPYRLLRVRGAADNKGIAHVCGTCRFGDDPRTSVLDANCRAHGVDNLYVVDASIFPSSGGINPSLTIAANALRVAEHLDSRL